VRTSPLSSLTSTAVAGHAHAPHADYASLRLVVYATCGVIVTSSPTVMHGVTHEKGWETPATIQGVTLPVLLGSRKNVMVQSPAGSGKTGCFALAMLLGINPALPPTSVQCLCVTPSHLLAQQVTTVIQQIALQHMKPGAAGTAAPAKLPAQVVCLSNITRQRKKVTSAQGTVFVGTPGTTKKLKKAQLANCKVRGGRRESVTFSVFLWCTSVVCREVSRVPLGGGDRVACWLSLRLGAAPCHGRGRRADVQRHHGTRYEGHSKVAAGRLPCHYVLCDL